SPTFRLKTLFCAPAWIEKRASARTSRLTSSCTLILTWRAVTSLIELPRSASVLRRGMAEYSVRVHETGVVIFRLPDQSQKVIDNWIEDLARLGQAWIAEEIALLLIDMRGMGIPSLYNATNLHRISRASPAASRVRTAFLFDPGTATVL